ncbi:MAG TPA: cbb3-type cytochrome c oxidase subunit I [Puia sp.]|nr:cbb3-type cytochrome c oxidase subunit I [Puia sp.]
MKKFLQLLLVACLATILPFTLVWNYRMFVTSLNPFLGAISAFMTILIGVLLAARMIKRRARNRAYSPAILFAMGSVCCLFAAVLETLLQGKSTLDIQLHDTYYVLAFHQIMQYVALIFGVFAAIYYWYPKWFGRPLNTSLSYIHFWATFAGAYFICWPVRYYEFEGLAGMPRRYIDYSHPLPPQYFEWINSFMLAAVTGLLIAQLLFVFNFFYSLLKKPRNS